MIKSTVTFFRHTRTQVKRYVSTLCFLYQANGTAKDSNQKRITTITRDRCAAQLTHAYTLRTRWHERQIAANRTWIKRNIHNDGAHSFRTPSLFNRNDRGPASSYGILPAGLSSSRLHTVEFRLHFCCRSNAVLSHWLNNFHQLLCNSIKSEFFLRYFYFWWVFFWIILLKINYWMIICIRIHIGWDKSLCFVWKFPITFLPEFIWHIPCYNYWSLHLFLLIKCKFISFTYVLFNFQIF